MSVHSMRRTDAIQQIQADTGIDEEMIERLIRGFYGRVRRDQLLGPIFEARIDDWGPHLRRMCDFWSSAILMSGRYHGQPMRKHLPLPIEAAHFERWLSLFEATARELCPPPAADHFVKRACWIGASLELGVATARGILLHKGERLATTPTGIPASSTPRTP